MSKPTVGIFGLTGCAGDQLVILNCEDRLMDIVALLDVRDFLMASSENETIAASRSVAISSSIASFSICHASGIRSSASACAQKPSCSPAR